DLDAQPSRRTRLLDMIGRYAFRDDTTTLGLLRAALEQARDELGDRAAADDDDRNDRLRTLAERALRLADAENWEAVQGTLPDGRLTKTATITMQNGTGERW